MASRDPTAVSPEDHDFASEGLFFRQKPLPARILSATWSFTRHKPLGAVGVAIVLIWTLFAVGTVGDGGGWMGIGRYNSLDVFREGSKAFANNKAADHLVGLPADSTESDLLARFDSPDYLGVLAVSQEVDGELHEYVVGLIEDGKLISTLEAIRPPLIDTSTGVFVKVEDLLRTGTNTPLRTASLQGPSSKHWLGTDRAGQDLYARVTEGARLSLTVGFFAALFATGLGTLIGLASGYLGGTVDLLSNRLMDALQAFPPIVFLLLIASVTKGDNLVILILALGAVGVAGSQRIARGSVLQARQEQYVEAARTIGASGPRIMLRHVLPNIMAAVIVVFSISIGLYILAEAALSFLGLGPVQVSWGKMVSDGRQFIISGGAPWISLWSGLAITTLVYGFNVAGDALRDVLDPRLRGA